MFRAQESAECTRLSVFRRSFGRGWTMPPVTITKYGMLNDRNVELPQDLIASITFLAPLLAYDDTREGEAAGSPPLQRAACALLRGAITSARAVLVAERERRQREGERDEGGDGPDSSD